jgi:hypothetical protein
MPEVPRNLEEALFELVEPVRREIRMRSPNVKLFKMGAIRTYPQAPSQYEGHSGRLHSDYRGSVNQRPPSERPYSAIIAIDEFDFIYLPFRDGTRENMLTQTVVPGQAMLFTNNCLHSGGANPTDKWLYRIFMYAVSDIEDFPGKHIFFAPWSSTDPKARLSGMEEEGDDEESASPEAARKANSFGRLVSAKSYSEAGFSLPAPKGQSSTTSKKQKGKIVKKSAKKGGKAVQKPKGKVEKAVQKIQLKV